MYGMKEVDFGKYCTRCKYKYTAEWDDPCDMCLNIFTRPFSHKPQYFEEDKNVTAKRKGYAKTRKVPVKRKENSDR